MRRRYVTSNESLEQRLTEYIEDYCIDELNRLPVEGRMWVEMDYNDFYAYDTNLAHSLLDEHEHYLELFDAIFTAKLRVTAHEYVESIGQVETRIINLVETTQIHLLDAGHVDRLIQIQGTVIQRGKPLVRVTEMAFKCSGCGVTVLEPQTQQYREYPKPCDCDYKGKKWIHIYKDSKFEDYQEIVIQANLDNMESISTDKVKVVLTGSLIRGCEAGEDVTIVGALQAYDSSQRSKSIELDYRIEANSLINVTESKRIEITTEDREQVKTLMTNPFHRQRVIESIAPTLYGLNHVKEALAYQQCEGQVKYPNNARRRGQFHILLAGPPGCGKSELGEFMVKCHPKSHKSVGRGASGVGLTASVVKENEQFVLKAGAMRLADRGFLFVDEIEKMNQSDSAMMHPGMEQQEIVIDKADISATLKTRCSMLAACNPLGGVWNEYKTFRDNLHGAGKGLALPLLDRFALIFVIKQNKDTKKEREVIEHIMKVNADPQSIVPPYSIGELRIIFAYARSIKVTCPKEVMKKLEEFYMTLYEASKQDETLMITRRQPEDLIRLTEASARLHGRDIAIVEDAENAKRMVAKSLEEYGIDPFTGKIDQATALYGKPKTDSQKLGEIPVVVKRLCERNIDSTKISRLMLVQYLVTHWHTDNSEVAKLLEIALRDGTIYCPTPYDIAVS